MKCIMRQAKTFSFALLPVDRGLRGQTFYHTEFRVECISIRRHWTCDVVVAVLDSFFVTIHSRCGSQRKSKYIKCKIQM